jgi:hypothetical protein
MEVKVNFVSTLVLLFINYFVHRYPILVVRFKDIENPKITPPINITFFG